MVVSGAWVSMVQLKLNGVGSGLPAVSVAVTVKAWLPGAKPLYVTEPLLQAAAASLSSWQTKVAPSVAWKVKVAVLLLVMPFGAVSISVSGAWMSMVHV